MLSKRGYGFKVEEHALRWFLENRPGSRCIAKNYYSKVGELDLVFEEPGPRGVELVFLEVKARIGVPPSYECVDYRKRRRLALAAKRFLIRYRGPASQIRFDFLVWDGSDWDHLINAEL
ncbi:YraN family protein [bacterium]|jgi:Holliday junction resolvase-like predicted endonuclease|nr:YraN family protein [bacterium]